MTNTNRPELVARQGDVYIFKAPIETVAGETIPKQARLTVLALGEATGHMHVVRGGGAKLFQRAETQMRTTFDWAAGDRLLHIGGKGAALMHEKAGQLTGEHATVDLPPGNYVVRIQREWSGEDERTVAD
jgi:hypothetical protein